MQFIVKRIASQRFESQHLLMVKKKAVLSDDKEFEKRQERLRKRHALIRAGISGPYASQIVNGERRPGYKLSLEIYEKTGLEFGDGVRHARRAVTAGTAVAEKKPKKPNAHDADTQEK